LVSKIISEITFFGRYGFSDRHDRENDIGICIHSCRDNHYYRDLLCQGFGPCYKSKLYCNNNL